MWTFDEGRDGSLWIGTLGGGLIRLKEGKFTSYTTQEGLLHDDVRTVYEDQEGSLWIGTPVGLSRWKDGRWNTFYE
ncbi:MAG: two-component regulator propeller domain-containing protein [Pyrinomonadaceae bacterium]